MRIYGSDTHPAGRGRLVSGYDPQRGEQVIAWVRRFLDESLPLESGSYQDVVAFKVVDKQLRIQLKNGKETTLRTPATACRLPWRCRCADPHFAEK
ncbi:hypothetical protein O5558_03595 [Escherichia coli]|nr:hypothetical protein [Escherichia coli]